MISRLSANMSDSRARDKCCANSKADSKIELPTSASGYRMREAENANASRVEEVGVYAMIVCTRARTAWMNVARKSLREICYFRRDCVLSTCLYTGCHWISGLKFASVFLYANRTVADNRDFNLYINCVLINYLNDIPSPQDYLCVFLLEHWNITII